MTKRDKQRIPRESVFKCADCGLVKPPRIFYSCPAQAECPGCGKNLTEEWKIPVKNGGSRCRTL